MATQLCGRKPAIRQMIRIKRPLDHSDRRAAERAAHHDLHSRDRRDQRLLEKAELAVPEHRDAGKDGAEEHCHSDHARAP